MNKTSFALIALVVALCVAYAAGQWQASEESFWHCGGVDGQALVRPSYGVSARWTNANDKTCKKTCKKGRSYPVYKKGNWGLFTGTGLVCCCSVRRLFGKSHHPYGPTTPYISWEMAARMGMRDRTPPTD